MYIGRIISLVLTLMVSLALSAENGATSFMGIPVDGSVKSMKRSLALKGFSLTKNGGMKGVYEGVTYTLDICTHKHKVYRIQLTECEGVTDIKTAIAKYNGLLEVYRNNPLYTEYEYNWPALKKDEPFYEDFLQQGAYYAEFFQISDPQLYSKLVNIRIAEVEDTYRIVICFDNIFNKPNGVL